MREVEVSAQNGYEHCYADVWYHHAALARMYNAAERPIPTHIMQWAKANVDFLDAVSVIEPEKYEKIPILKVITTYGIYFGVHGFIEEYHLSTQKVNHQNVVDVCRRMAVITHMRKYLNQHWDHLLDPDQANWTSPPETFGCNTVRGVFSLSPSFQPGYAEGCGSLRADIVPQPDYHRLVMESEISSDIETEKRMMDMAKSIDRIIEDDESSNSSEE